MDRDEALELLRGGYDRVLQWNHRRYSEVIPPLNCADLHGTCLRGVHLQETNLRKANLRDADLMAAHLYGADLREADLCEAVIHGALLHRANLYKAKLRRTILKDSICEETNLCEADLRGADLSGVFFNNAQLCKADLTGTNLKLSRFIKCDLQDAIVDDAIVTNIDFQGLRGLPKPPETLRLIINDRELILTDHEAREFFHLPAIIEVYITKELTQRELGCFHFHLGDLHDQGVATNVYFVAHRCENDGSVLRFQAKSYEEMYQLLPDLLAPFRMSYAVDWEKSIQAIPAENRGEAISTLVKMETRRPTGRWRFAERMAEIFRGYRTARVYQISEGRHQGLRIDIFTNQQIADRLSRMALPKPWDIQKKIRIETGGGTSNIQLIEGNYMSEQHIHGGHFQGCSFGDDNSLTNYFGVVDNIGNVEEDIKQKLKEAREAIESADLHDTDKADVVEQLKNLTVELEKPEKDTSRIQRFWNRIKEVAPTVASILASAASLAKILGG